jgi:hypothetical protein
MHLVKPRISPSQPQLQTCKHMCDWAKLRRKYNWITLHDCVLERRKSPIGVQQVSLQVSLKSGDRGCYRALGVIKKQVQDS